MGGKQMSSMSVNVNVHHPQVQPGELGVHRSNTGEQLVIALNDSDVYGGVTLFLSDQEFDAIVSRVNAFRESEQQVSGTYPDWAGWVHDADQ
jgi:hypothetical protein